MDFVGQHDAAIFVQAQLVLGVGQDQAPLGRHGLAAREQPERIVPDLLPLLGAEQTALQDLVGRERRVVIAGVGLGGGGDDWLGQLLVGPHAVLEARAIHLAPTLVVEGQDGGAGRARQITAHHDLHRQDGQPPGQQHVGVGIRDHMVGADVGGRFEPVSRRLGQHLALERHGGQD